MSCERSISEPLSDELARRILRAHIILYCAYRKERSGKNTSGVFGQVLVHVISYVILLFSRDYRSIIIMIAITLSPE